MLALEKNVDHGVRVVAPPATRTDRVSGLPRGRAEPDGAADLAVFLASDCAGHIGGVVVSLDRGQTARH